MLALAALAAVAAVAPLAEGHQVRRGCAGKITRFATPAGTFYVDDHGDNPPVGPPLANEWWVYMESNNHAGLQKGGYQPVVAALAGRETTEEAGWHDRCDTTRDRRHSRRLKPDTIIF